MIFEKIINKEFKVDCVPEFKFHPVRKWRADYAIPDWRILIEVEGGVWGYGRHNRAAGFIKDMEKYNTATSLGWSILRVLPNKLMSKETLDLIKATKESNGH